VALLFAGATKGAKPVGESRLKHTINHYGGKSNGGTHRAIPSYRSVRYRDVYPGVDAVFHRERGGLRYEFIVDPGADPTRIRLKLAGIEGLAVDRAGNLVLRTGARPVVHTRPVLYQEVGGKRRRVGGAFVRHDALEFGFKTGRFDRRLPLIIDPGVLLGGSGGEFNETVGLAVDDAGQVWLAGRTRSTDFPLVDPVQPVHGGGLWDSFVVKLDLSDPTAPAVAFATYFGGGEADWAWDVAIDPTGNAYVAGRTGSDDFPVLDALQPTIGSTPSHDAYVAKFDDQGGLVFATYLGGSGSDAARGIAVHNSGIYVAGFTGSTDFPTQAPFQPNLGVGALDNGFVAKLSHDGSGLVYATYLGGGSEIDIHAIAVFGGSAYVTGTAGPDMPTVNAAEPTFQGGQTDAFVARLEPDGSGLVFATYLGGDANDSGDSLAVDAAGEAHVGGRTNSAAGFPLIDAQQPVFGGVGDGFVARLSASGTFEYATYLGGSARDRITGIAVSDTDAVFVSGVTTSTDFPTVDAWYPTNLSTPAFDDAFVAAYDDAGAVYFATYLGGGGGDIGHSVALDGAGAVYVAGTTNSLDFLEGGAADLSAGTGPFDSDVFLVKSDLPIPVDLHITKADYNDPADVGDSVPYALTITNESDEDATGVQIADALPPGYTVVVSSLPPGRQSQAGGTVVRCLIGTLPAGQTTQLIFEATPSQPGTLTNTAFVEGDQPDPDPTDNTAEEETTVEAPPTTLEIEKTASVEPVPLGSPVTYFVRVINRGPSPVTGVHVTDSIPVGKVLLMQSAVPTQGSCTVLAQATADCDLGDIAVDHSALVTVVAAANGLGSATNTAVAHANETGGQAWVAIVTSTVIAAVTADLSATIEPAAPSPGAIGFHVRVRNETTGTVAPTVGLSVVLTGQDLNVAVANLAAGDGSCAAITPAGQPPRVECNLTSLAAGDDILVWIVATSTTLQTVDVSASVASDSVADNVPANDSDTASLQLP